MDSNTFTICFYSFTNNGLKPKSNPTQSNGSQGTPPSPVQLISVTSDLTQPPPPHLPPPPNQDNIYGKSSITEIEEDSLTKTVLDLQIGLESGDKTLADVQNALKNNSVVKALQSSKRKLHDLLAFILEMDLGASDTPTVFIVMLCMKGKYGLSDTDSTVTADVLNRLVTELKTACPGTEVTLFNARAGPCAQITKDSVFQNCVPLCEGEKALAKTLLNLAVVMLDKRPGAGKVKAIVCGSAEVAKFVCNDNSVRLLEKNVDLLVKNSPTALEDVIVVAFPHLKFTSDKSKAMPAIKAGASPSLAALNASTALAAVEAVLTSGSPNPDERMVKKYFDAISQSPRTNLPSSAIALDITKNGVGVDEEARRVLVARGLALGSMKEADIFASQESKALEILTNNNEKGLTVEELEAAAQVLAQGKAVDRKEKQVAKGLALGSKYGLMTLDDCAKTFATKLMEENLGLTSDAANKQAVKHYSEIPRKKREALTGEKKRKKDEWNQKNKEKRQKQQTERIVCPHCLKGCGTAGHKSREDRPAYKHLDENDECLNSKAVSITVWANKLKGKILTKRSKKMEKK